MLKLYIKLYALFTKANAVLADDFETQKARVLQRQQRATVAAYEAAYNMEKKYNSTKEISITDDLD